MKVLDVQGRLIKTVANNETLAVEGFYRWDGDRDDGSYARSATTLFGLKCLARAVRQLFFANG